MSMGPTGPGYAQKDPHMREMEREAYEKGNMCFRHQISDITDRDVPI